MSQRKFGRFAIQAGRPNFLRQRWCLNFSMTHFLESFLLRAHLIWPSEDKHIGEMSPKPTSPSTEMTPVHNIAPVDTDLQNIGLRNEHNDVATRSPSAGELYAITFFYRACDVGRAKHGDLRSSLTCSCHPKMV